VHGLTATPDEVRPLGDALSTAGFRCHAVRLPGHATTVADLATVRRQAWLATVEDAAGVSLGALLSLAVAASGRFPVRALVLLGTPLHLANERATWLRFLAWMPGVAGPSRILPKRHGRDILDEQARAASRAYDAMPVAAVAELLRLRAQVKRALHRVTIPTLVLHGRHDRTAPVANVETLQRLLPGRPLEVAVFERSAHVLTEDAERDAVAARIVEFLSRIESLPR
jgi:carboxylesterase